MAIGRRLGFLSNYQILQCNSFVKSTSTLKCFKFLYGIELIFFIVSAPFFICFVRGRAIPVSVKPVAKASEQIQLHNFSYQLILCHSQ